MKVLSLAFVVAFVFGLAIVTSPLQAQHKVSLRIGPRVGDTLKMRYDQQVDMMGVRESPADRGTTVRDSTVMRATMLTVLSRAIVEGTSATGTDLLAVTDSVAISTTEEGAIQSEDLASEALVGRQVHLRVTPDGATSIADSTGASPELRAVFAQMPATLPATPIAVGQTWKRTMGVPMHSPLHQSGHQHGAPPATLTATFRLDSLSRDGSAAYISMQGALAHTSEHEPPGAMRVTMTGNVTGSMIVDRRRGWLIDSHAVIAISSVILPPLSSPASAPSLTSAATTTGAMPGPTHVEMIVTQWLRTVN